MTGQTSRLVVDLQRPEDIVTIVAGGRIEEQGDLTAQIPRGRILLPRPDKFRLLAVDDEATVLLMARRVLEKEGYVVDGAASGAEAIEKVQSEDEYHGYLLDWDLRDMTGIDVMRHVRRKDPEAFVVLYSGAMTPDRITVATAAQANVALAKPYENHQLVGAFLGMVTRYE